MKKSITLVVGSIWLFGASMSYAASELYHPAWVDEFAWSMDDRFHSVPGSMSFLEDLRSPWWQSNRVQHPITDYDAGKLAVGDVRIDSVFNAELTTHQALRGWDVEKSANGITYAWDYNSSRTSREKQVSRSGQSAYFNLGVRPWSSISADIGAELIGNYDDRFWHPVNDELRLHNEKQVARIVRSEVKYDNQKNFMLRGFQGTPNFHWTYENDLFHLVPTQLDVEYYRRLSGSVTPRGGEMRLKTDYGNLRVMGGSEVRWGYGPSLYVKYDVPSSSDFQTSLLYTREEIPFGETDEHRWNVAANSSLALSEKTTLFGGILYQPFRLNTPFQQVSGITQDGSGNVTSADIKQRRTIERDAFGFTTRIQTQPKTLVDQLGLGYLYAGPVAGNKHQFDGDATKNLSAVSAFSMAYQYRRPVIGPAPLIFQGTQNNPGALLSNPRGPFDPFRVTWENREMHLAQFTWTYDPTPATAYFVYQKNVLEDWNINPAEDAPFNMALQYRIQHYPTNTDRLYFYDPDRQLFFDPIREPGALATSRPIHSASAIFQIKQDHRTLRLDLAGGEAAAGSATTYQTTVANGGTNYGKPSTVFMTAGLTGIQGPWKAFVRFSKDVWGPLEYHPQFGATYHRLYQAGLSYDFLKDFQTGVRYTGARQSSDYFCNDGQDCPDRGAFDEWRIYLTYHFTYKKNVGKIAEPLGRPIAPILPQVGLSISSAQLQPDATGKAYQPIQLMPKADSQSGILSWKLLINNADGKTVRSWQGRGSPQASYDWNGLDSQGLPVTAGTYRGVFEIADLYGNEVGSEAYEMVVPALAAQPAPAAPVAEVKPAETPEVSKDYQVVETKEGLKVTLSSRVLFASGSAELKGESKRALAQVAELLKAYPKNALRITGYTDSVGSAGYNQKLAEKRAESVAAVLNRNFKIDVSRLTVRGAGAKNPVASNATEEGRQQNRRVEVDILK